jgi:hypothetical protein
VHALDRAATVTGFRTSEDNACLRPLGYRDRLRAGEDNACLRPLGYRDRPACRKLESDNIFWESLLAFVLCIMDDYTRAIFVTGSTMYMYRMIVNYCRGFRGL